MTVFQVFQRIFLGGACVWSLRASSQVLDQDAHNRVLATESWRGSYIRSTAIRSLGTVRFDVCGREQENQCRALTGNFPWEKIEAAEGPLLTKLEALLADLKKKKDSGVLSYVTGGSAKDADVRALSGTIAQIRADHLRNWLLLTKQNIQREPPAFATPEISEKVYAIFRDQFTETTVPARNSIPRMADSRTCHPGNLDQFAGAMNSILGAKIESGK